MESVKRSTSVDTLSEYVAQMQTSPPSADPSSSTSSSSTDPNGSSVEHVLLSCTLNVEESPIEFYAESIPIETPEYVHEIKVCTEGDLYFLRWVFEGCFDKLTSYLQKNFADFKVLRAQPEPGINWTEFREGRRGFLVWLVRTKKKDDPLAALSDLLNGGGKPASQDVVQGLQAAPTTTGTTSREALLASLVGKQVGVVRRQMRQFYKEIEETERQMSQIWNLVSRAGLHEHAEEQDLIHDADDDGDDDAAPVKPLTMTALEGASRHPRNIVKTGNATSVVPLTEYHGEGGASEWSVVDEDEDRELTSLSGYDSASDGD